MPDLNTPQPDQICNVIDRAFARSLGPEAPPQTKTCPDCITPKPISAFGFARHRADGRSRVCRVCNARRAARVRDNARQRKAARRNTIDEGAREEAKRQAEALREQQRRQERTQAPKLSYAEKQEIKTARAVYDAILSGARTRREIRGKTGFTFERIGDGIADLLTGRAKPLIRLERDEKETARFFPVAQRAEVRA